MLFSFSAVNLLRFFSIDAVINSESIALQNLGASRLCSLDRLKSQCKHSSTRPLPALNNKNTIHSDKKQDRLRHYDTELDQFTTK